MQPGFRKSSLIKANPGDVTHLACVMVLLLYSYADTKTEPVNFHDFMVKFDRFSDDPSNAEVDLLNEKRGRLQSLLLSQPNTKAVLEVPVMLLT